MTSLVPEVDFRFATVAPDILSLQKEQREVARAFPKIEAEISRDQVESHTRRAHSFAVVGVLLSLSLSPLRRAESFISVYIGVLHPLPQDSLERKFSHE